MKKWLPNILEGFVILGSAAANICMSVIGFPWATVTITNSLISGTVLMSLNQTRKKIRELDKKLIANGRQKLNFSTKIQYWIAPSVSLVITMGLLSYYGITLMLLIPNCGLTYLLLVEPQSYYLIQEKLLIVYFEKK